MTSHVFRGVLRPCHPRAGSTFLQGLSAHGLPPPQGGMHRVGYTGSYSRCILPPCMSWFYLTSRSHFKHKLERLPNLPSSESKTVDFMDYFHVPSSSVPTPFWIISATERGRTREICQSLVQLYPGHQCGYRVPSTWTVFHCFLRYINKEMGWK